MYSTQNHMKKHHNSVPCMYIDTTINTAYIQQATYSPVSQHVGEGREVSSGISPTVARLQTGLIGQLLVISSIRTNGVYDGRGVVWGLVAVTVQFLGASYLWEHPLGEECEVKVTQAGGPTAAQWVGSDRTHLMSLTEYI